MLNSPGISEICPPSLSSISKMAFEILIAYTVFKKKSVWVNKVELWRIELYIEL